jgi:hypothetical protein
MITNILLYIFSEIIHIFAQILPTWQVWPTALTDGLTYFFQQLAFLDFLFPIDTLFTVILFFITFEVAYFSAKILIKIVNFLRGTGSGLDI